MAVIDNFAFAASVFFGSTCATFSLVDNLSFLADVFLLNTQFHVSGIHDGVEITHRGTLCCLPVIVGSSSAAGHNSLVLDAVIFTPVFSVAAATAVMVFNDASPPPLAE